MTKKHGLMFRDTACGDHHCPPTVLVCGYLSQFKSYLIFPLISYEWILISFPEELHFCRTSENPQDIWKYNRDGRQKKFSFYLAKLISGNWINLDLERRFRLLIFFFKLEKPWETGGEMIPPPILFWLFRHAESVSEETGHVLISWELPLGVFWQFILRDSCQHGGISSGGEAGGDPHQGSVGVHGGARVGRHLWLQCKMQQRKKKKKGDVILAQNLKTTSIWYQASSEPWY